jgi:hypothetical protein
METTRRIKPLPTRPIYIVNAHTYKDFFRKGYKVMPTWTGKIFDRPSFLSRDTLEQEMRRRLLKLVKRIKYRSTINFRECHIRSKKFVPERSVFIGKKISRINNLFMMDYHNLREKQFMLLNVFLKQVKRLRNLEFQVMRDDPPGALLMNNNGQAFQFSKEKLKPKLFLKNLKYQNGLNRFHINMPRTFCPIFQRFYKFDNYPSTLQHLSIHGGWFREEAEGSLSHLKNLKSLRVTIMKTSSHKFTRSLLQRIPQVPQIENLDLHMRQDSTPEIAAEVGVLKQLQNLKRFRLAFLTAPDDFESVLTPFNHHALTHLTISAKIARENQLAPVAGFLRCFPRLTYLKLKFINESFFQTKDNICDIIAQTEQLQELTVLRLSFMTQARVNKKGLLAGFKPNFNRIAAKPVQLQVFTFECNQLSNPSKVFIDILKSLENIAVNLQKLKIDVGEALPQKVEYPLILKFIHALQNVRILKLRNLALPTRQFFFDLVEQIHPFKYLRRLALGEFKGTMGPTEFIDAIEKILLKSGLENFECDASWEFKRELASQRKLSLEEIMTKNPNLLTAPRCTPVVEYDENYESEDQDDKNETEAT